MPIFPRMKINPLIGAHEIKELVIRVTQRKCLNRIDGIRGGMGVNLDRINAHVRLVSNGELNKIATNIAGCDFLMTFLPGNGRNPDEVVQV